MTVILVVLVGVLFAASLAGTHLFTRYATRAQLFDMPNARSSHGVPVPRGGGLVFSILTLLALGVWSALGPADDALPWGALFACWAVLFLGFLDDRMSLPAIARLACQFVASGALVLSLGTIPSLPLLGGLELNDGVLLAVLCVVGLVWLINLYNFMDGIDSLAAGEGLFVAICGIALCLLRGETGVATWLLIQAACLAGFLFWNIPPAKVFMGDAGSVFLGFFFGVIALYSHARGGPEIWVWLILLGTFCVDATVTLLRRIRFGERPLEAHRTHAYQYLSRHYGSHGRVSAGVMVLNVCWLAPLALATTLFPAFGMALVLVAYSPLVVIAWRAGAGVPERCGNLPL